MSYVAQSKSLTLTFFQEGKIFGTQFVESCGFPERIYSGKLCESTDENAAFRAFSRLCTIADGPENWQFLDHTTQHCYLL